MADKQYCSSFLLRNRFHLAQAFFLKLGIADGEHLIDKKNFRFKRGSYRECEPHIHAARVTFDRCIEKFFGLRERNDFIEFRCDLSAAHAKDGAVQENVLGGGQLRMKPGPDLQQRSDPPANSDPPFGRLSYS